MAIRRPAPACGSVGCGPGVEGLEGGAPGSAFTLAGSAFPADGTGTITVNGHQLGTFATDAVGSFALMLTTAGADEGLYVVTATMNPSASVRLVLDADQPVRPPEGTGKTMAIPLGIALAHQVFLSLVQRTGP